MCSANTLAMSSYILMVLGGNIWPMFGSVGKFKLMLILQKGREITRNGKNLLLVTIKKMYSLTQSHYSCFELC